MEGTIHPLEVPEIDYRNKVILAPMVRVGTLPFRLLAKQQGADIVYGEELVDHALLTATRVVNDALGTVDFIKADGKLVYRTCKEDYPNVFQIGTSNAVNALRVAEKVYADVAAIDINMGCPKHFSVQGGMGAALLCQPETVRDILTTLVRNIPKPITCKIRINPDLHKTLEFLKIVESCGIKAVGIHARYKEERPSQPAHWDALKFIIDSKPINIPIIANGDVMCYEDIAKIRAETGVTSVMIARGAARNPSVFNPQPKPVMDMMKEYTRLAVLYDNNYSNSKYTLMYMSKEADNGKWLSSSPEGVLLHRSKKYEEICKMWDMDKDRIEIEESLAKKKALLSSKRLSHTEECEGPLKKKTRTEELEQGGE